MNPQQQVPIEFATCPICLTDLRDEGAHRLTLLACGHYFGRSCLMAALEISPNCPVCGQAAHDQLVQVFGLGLEEARLVINNFQMENQQLRALLDAGEGNNAPLVQYIANQLRNAMIGLGDAISGIQIFGQNVIGNWIAALEGLSGALRVMMELQQAGGIGNEVQEGGVEIEAVGEDEGQEAAGLAGQVVGPDADVAWRGHVVFVRFLEGTSISYNILFDALKFAGWIQRDENGVPLILIAPQPMVGALVHFVNDDQANEAVAIFNGRRIGGLLLRSPSGTFRCHLE